jgi:hypothetical protein
MFGWYVSDKEGEPVGLWMGLQAGMVVGVFLGFSLAQISFLTDNDEIKRTFSFLCITPLVCPILLGPLLARRRKPVELKKIPIQEARKLLEPFNEGKGNWRVLSHVTSDGLNLRIDMHNLKNIEGVVDAALILADNNTVRFIVGRGNSKSSSPELREKVLSRIESKVSILRRTRKAKSIVVDPQESLESSKYYTNLNRILFLILIPIISFVAWLEMRN